MIRDSRGMTLIELLVVMVILSILALIAVLGFQTIIEQSRDRAFIANSQALKQAARNYYLSNNLEEDMNVTYQQLVESGFVEPIRDPYTKTMMPTDDNDTFVRIEHTTSGKRYLICYLGETKKLCESNDKPILIDSLTVNDIENK
ncbi:MAG: prepilin-type N-terminal cleavage/methylation domain-containing protein [Bacillaceae bacterium]|nr:prepilin-type N-terminal cleavage/methylation domain-containing protein [Bacillaceae bacterium]